MLAINLLPWRKNYYHVAIKRVGCGLVLIAALSFLIILDGRIILQQKMHLAALRVAQLKNLEFALGPKYIAHINWEKQASQAESFNTHAKQLAAAANSTLKLFYVLNASMPQDVTLDLLQRVEGHVILHGKALQTESVTQLLRQLEKSNFFTDIYLQEITSGADLYRNFSLNLTINYHEH
jgi:Tfp pilus assembly protein PilN